MLFRSAEPLHVLPDGLVGVGERGGAREHLLGDPVMELRRVHERRERVCILQTAPASLWEAVVVLVASLGGDRRVLPVDDEEDRPGLPASVGLQERGRGT